MPKEVHTRLRPSGGIEAYEVGDQLRKAVIDPVNDYPSKERNRFELPGWVLGKLEVLAQSRFEIFEASGKTRKELTTWSLDDPETVWSIVHTVHASSRIENEGVQASEVPVVYHAITKTLGQNTAELNLRQAAERDISLTYFWALSEDRRPLLSVEFIQELHRRMFHSTRGEIAGKFKTEPVIIADDEREFFDVTTLPPEKVEPFLRAACERAERAFFEADHYAQHSKLILVAEFLVDFLAIHPFTDGNGRAARLISTYLLERAGYHFAQFYPIDQVILDNRNSYFQALFSAQEHWYGSAENLTPWIEFYVNSVFKQWERAFAEIRDRAMKKSSDRTRR
jgi:Fic family protein